MAEYLKSENLIPDLALVSDAARTRETAALALSQLPAIPSEFDNLIYTGEAEDWLRRIRTTPSKISTLLVVGHNPACHALAISLVGYGDRYAAQRLQRDYPTCGLTVLDFDVEDWSDIALHKARLDQFTVLKA